MNVEIITIGDELLIGQVVDTNSAWMGRELNKAGFDAGRITSISDDETEITAAIDEAVKRSPIVLITGGLGPTRDDITKQTLCKYFNTQLVFNSDVFNNVTQMLSNSTGAVNRLNREQAMVPEACEVIPNPVGTAPVMWFNHAGGSVVVSMPGVPAEMQFAMSNSVIPKLVEKFHTDVIVHKTVHIYNIPESVLAERLTEWENSLPPFIRLAYLPAYGKIRLRLSGRGDCADTITDAIRNSVEMLYPVIGESIYGFDDEPVEASLLELLRQKGATVSCAESCTGGNIAHLITSIAGASDCFKGGIVAYSNQIKKKLLNVSDNDLLRYGAVSREVVQQMALGACTALESNYAIATSGIAGPAGGTPQKPVGTVWIAWAGNGQVVSECFLFGDNRAVTVLRASETAVIRMKLMIESGF